MNPDFIKLATQNKKTIVLPESNDDRMLQAAVECDQKNIAHIILLGEENAINKELLKLKLSLGNIQTIDPEKCKNQNQLADLLFQLRSKKGLSHQDAKTQSKEPLTLANLMVKSGLADGCVAGAVHSTGEVIRAALQIVGTKSATTRLSSFFVMLTPILPTPIIFADCAINIAPNAEQLADIAFQSSENARSLLGLEPKVALLSFSTNGSAKHECVDKIREASELLHTNHPELNVIGDIQFDAAISNKILQKKWRDTNFKAPANVFIFPSLESGNICYKVAEQIGGATAIGPILQGLEKPVNDLSRGATVEAIVNTIAVTCVQSIKSTTH